MIPQERSATVFFQHGNFPAIMRNTFAVSHTEKIGENDFAETERFALTVWGPVVQSLVQRFQSERLRVRFWRSATFTPSAHVRRQSLPVWPPTLNKTLYLTIWASSAKQRTKKNSPPLSLSLRSLSSFFCFVSCLFLFLFPIIIIITTKNRGVFHTYILGIISTLYFCQISVVVRNFQASVSCSKGTFISVREMSGCTCFLQSDACFVPRRAKKTNFLAKFCHHETCPSHCDMT